MFGKKTKKKYKIFLIEDDAMLSKAMVGVLEDAGYEVKNVLEGSKASTTAAKFQPDLILLDLILPGLDGFGVLKEIKADTGLAKVPVVIVSNLDSPADVKSAQALGAEEFVLKATSSTEDIVKIVKKYLKG